MNTRWSPWFPAPLLSASVFVVWLLLNQSLALGHLLLALVLAWLLPLPAQRLRGGTAGIRRLGPVIPLLLVVLRDILLSSIDVGKRILLMPNRLTPGFIWVPLDLRNPHAVATLAGIITMTPGTLSAEVSPQFDHLLVHCFHLEDADATIAQIKSSYEAPLREIFE